jgi:hypothetical protein
MRRTHLPRGRSARASRSAPTAITALTCIALLLAMPAPAQSGPCTRPLLMQGKRTLFQRVLTRPGAVALDGPAGNRRQDLLAFSRLYVYGRGPRNGREWLRLGTDERCRNIVGWVDAAQTVPWRQQLSLALTNPSGRGRLLFFRALEDLMTVVDSADPAGSAQKLVEKLDAGLHVPAVVAVEPDTFVDPAQNTQGKTMFVDSDRFDAHQARTPKPRGARESCPLWQLRLRQRQRQRIDMPRLLLNRPLGYR